MQVWATAALAVAGVLVVTGASAQNDAHLAAKRAALEKLCDAQLLSPEECAHRRALLGADAAPGAAVAKPSFLFTDPGGRYSASAPAGWSASTRDNAATFGNGPAWATLIPSPALSPEQAINDFVNQVAAQYSNLKQGVGSRPQIGGHQAVYVEFTGLNPKNEFVALTFSGLLGPQGHVLIFMASAPADRQGEFAPSFKQILESIRFTGETR
jgi:hypothetical protein